MQNDGPLPFALEQYFRSWKTHDVDILTQIFHRDATYQINDSKKLEGIEPIVAYWQQNGREQQNVTYSVLAWAAAGDSIFACWRAAFHRLDKRADYALTGMLWIVLRESRIASFVEFFNKKVQNASK